MALKELIPVEMPLCFSLAQWTRITAIWSTGGDT